MLARRNRFHGYNSLRAVYTKGKVARGKYFAVRTLANSRRKTYRAAVVVSRKVHKSAVVRNRIRRRLYEQIRLQMPETSTQDIVVSVFTPDVADMPAEALAVEVRQLLSF